MILILLGFGVVHAVGAILIERTSVGRGDPPLVVASRAD